MSDQEQLATRIVNVIIKDFTDRRGLRQGWDMIDPDIQQEIKDTWHQLVMEEIDINSLGGERVSAT